MDFTSLFSSGLGQGINPLSSGLGFGASGGTGLQAPTSALMPNQGTGLFSLNPMQTALMFKGLSGFGNALGNRNTTPPAQILHAAAPMAQVSQAPYNQMLAAHLMR